MQHHTADVSVDSGLLYMLCEGDTVRMVVTGTVLEHCWDLTLIQIVA